MTYRRGYSNYYSAEQLRLISSLDKKFSSKPKQATTTDLKIFDDQSYSYPEMQKLDKKLEGCFFELFSAIR